MVVVLRWINVDDKGGSMPTLEIEADEAEQLLALRLRARREEFRKPSTFHTSCICGASIVTSERTCFCRCGRLIDLTAWGK